MLKNKKALVTGSSRGIGRKIVEVFLANGAEVWGLCSRPSAAREELEAFAAEKGSVFHEICADCSDSAALSETVKAALEQSGGFDVLVNNAGITKDGLSFRMKLEDWQNVLAVNLTAAFIVSQIVSNDMIRRKSGSIINMTSIVGLHGGAGQVNYSASKAGLIGYTKSLAKEVASRGVRVNAIAPGYVETDMTKAVNEKAREGWLQGSLSLPVPGGQACVLLAGAGRPACIRLSVSSMSRRHRKGAEGGGPLDSCGSASLCTCRLAGSSEGGSVSSCASASSHCHSPHRGLERPVLAASCPWKQKLHVILGGPEKSGSSGGMEVWGTGVGWDKRMARWKVCNRYEGMGGGTRLVSDDGQEHGLQVLLARVKVCWGHVESFRGSRAYLPESLDLQVQ